jgi:outer membrane protein assembly factor BamB
VSHFANLIVSDHALLTGDLPGSVTEVVRVLRPCGGVAWLGQPGEIGKKGHRLRRSDVERWLDSSPLSGWEIREDGGVWTTVRRGSLPGSGEWTHLYADPGNTACSHDTLLEPTGIQWFGRPGPQDIIDRHHRPMSPLYKNGRLFIPANDRVITVDAYNGAPLWELSVPYSRRIGALKNCGQMAVADDYLYIAVEDECRSVDMESGEVKSALKAPQRMAGETHDWGYLAVVDNQIVGSCTKRGASFYELSETTCDLLEGDFREMILCDYLFSLDRRTGDTLWTHQNGAVFNNTLAIGDGRVYCIESRNAQTVSDPDGRISPDEFCASDTYLVALDTQTGNPVWVTPFQFPFQHIMYLSYADGTVLAVGTYNQGDYVHYGLYAFYADSGDLKWKNSYQGDGIGGTHGEQWQHPVIIEHKVFSRPYVFDLHTGAKGAYKLNRGGHGCGGLSGSASYLFGRGWNPRMYRIHDGEESGTPLTVVNRPGCWINMIPSGGLVLLPESSSGCTCQFPMQLSIAFSPKETYVGF